MQIRNLPFALLVSAAISFAAESRASEPVVLAQAESMREGEEPPDPAEPEAEAPIPPKAPKGKPTSGIEEIVIRAGESEAVADYEAADSVTGFDASDLEALGAQSVEDLAAYTPNLEIVTSGATTPTFFIRGVGLNDFNANSTGAVAVYQDDVPINSPALQLGTLYDMEAVNILRGPQGTGLARNASAGAIKLYTRKPSGEYGSYLSSSYGNYQYMDFEGALEAPLYSDILSSRLAFRWTQRDGYVENGCANAPSDADQLATNRGHCGNVRPNQTGLTIPQGLPNRVNNLGNWAARGTLRFQPTLDMDWLSGVHGAMRDEDSRLGQTIGTSSFTCVELSPGEDISDFAPRERCYVGFPPVRGKKSQKAFGTGDVNGYTDPDVRAENAQIEAEIAAANCAPTDGLNSPCRQSARDAAKKALAPKLAENLDEDPYRGDYNLVGPTRNNTWGGYLNGDIALPWGISLSTVTGYDTYDRFIDVDLDQSPNTLFHIKTDDEGWQVTQDLKLAGMFSEQLPLRWEIGGWFLRESLDVNIDNSLPPPADIVGVAKRIYTQDIWSGAGYANLEWDIDDKFTLDGGFRWNVERKTIDYLLERSVNVAAQEDETWQAPTGTARLTYRFREDTHVYWKYTRGWKPGHYNATGSLFTGLDAAEPETIDAFETGLRGSWFEGRLGLDWSVFYYDYDQYQLFTVKVDPGASPEFVVINASDAVVYGSELDLVARPFPGTFINVRASWLESEFVDFVQNQFVQQNVGVEAFNVLKEVNNTGNRLLNSPRFKVSVSAEQSIPLGRFGTLTARYDMAWTDDTYYDATAGRGIVNDQNLIWMPENAIGQPAYFVHNLRVGYRPPIGNIEIAGWVRNLADEVYRTFAFDASNFTNTTIHLVGTPRTYGLTLSIGF